MALSWFGLFGAAAFFVPAAALAQAQPMKCPADFDQLSKALKASVKASGGPTNGGLDNNMWAAIVARDGTLCAITRTGKNIGDQWPASRGIAIAKANTANGLSLPNFALSTANLWAASQPGGYLYGAITAAPPDATTLYQGPSANYGTRQDPALQHVVGGTIVFGGGLALYDGHTVVGALGVSGDTSCGDHNVAWRTRHALGLDRVPGGPTAKRNDAIVYDVGAGGKSKSGFGHPTCGHHEAQVAQQIGASAQAAPPPK
ncbi:MAG TPA: heme-binding protein [Rhizomicrobium sp.]|nr:heme-binding protein [Rhizomicrobium sp.]